MNNHVITAALAGVLNSFWIAVALALAAWVLLRCLPRSNAATRHLLWWTVLALLLVLPIRSVNRESRPGALVSPRAVVQAPLGRPVYRAAMAAAPAVFPVRVSGGRWLVPVFLLWVLFALVQLWRIAWSFVHLRAVKRRSQEAPESLRGSFHAWVRACGVRRPVRLLVSQQIASPMAVGFRRPAVILPAPLLEQFRERELDHVFLHELAHVVRRDDWTNLAARCLTAVIGLHPVAAWILRQIGRERELACDDWVVSTTGEARPYAASLARLFELCRARRGMLLATGMAGSASHLGERIDSLLARGRQFHARVYLPGIAAAAVVLLGVAVAGVRAPRWVVLAQSSTPVGPVRAGSRGPAPVDRHGSFLAALVAAGYGDLSVEDIIALKDHGVTAGYLADISQSGRERMTAVELMDLHAHGIPPRFLRVLRDSGFTHVGLQEAMFAFERGVTADTLRKAAEYGSQLTLAQIVRLKETGVL